MQVPLFPGMKLTLERDCQSTEPSLSLLIQGIIISESSYFLVQFPLISLTLNKELET